MAHSVAASTHAPSTPGGGTPSRSVHQIAAEYCELRVAEFGTSLPPSLAGEHRRARGDVVPSRPGPRVETVKASALDRLAPFERDEVSLGPKLGAGEFGVVYEVRSFHLRDSPGEWGEEDSESRRGMCRMESYRETGKARYAMKRIKDDFIRRRGEEEYFQAAGDLALEAEFLATLSHPNIIKLRGVASSGVAGFANGPEGYFLIIDRLFETLDQRIEKWHGPAKNKAAKMPNAMKKSIQSLSRLKSSLSKPSNGDNKLLDECLFVGLQISAAMAYLHRNSIIFRDLKPENVGFDVRGDLKIFDFGLARFMPKGGDDYNDVFEMSGAGSPRYMAPELLCGEDYNLKADVHTFALVLWTILTGDPPYSFIRSRAELIHFVVEEGGRPDLRNSWPAEIQGLLRNSFDADVHERPTMQCLFEKIRGVLISLRGSRKGLTDTHVGRRRSALSFQRLDAKALA